MIHIIKELISIEEAGGNSVIAAGIGSPGIIRMEKGVIVASPNFPDWRNVPMRSRIERSLGLPVLLDNDANAAAFGEIWRGAGRKVRSLVCMTLGTGIGGGIILGGDVWHGDGGMAGEVGHITVNPEGPRCNCGNYGCLEAYSSATGMVRSAAEAIGDGKRTALKRHAGDLTAKRIHEAAMKGDRVSAAILKEAGRYLGIAMATLINLLDIEMIVLTGAVTGAWDFFMPAAMEEVERRTCGGKIRRTKIAKGKLPGTAGVIGAAGLAWKRPA